MLDRRLLLNLAVFVGASLAPHIAVGTGRGEDGAQQEEWKLVFTDEFDGTELDKDKWTTCYWWDHDGCTNLSTNELEWYLPGNTKVAIGQLQLSAVQRITHRKGASPCRLSHSGAAA